MFGGKLIQLYICFQRSGGPIKDASGLGEGSRGCGLDLQNPLQPGGTRAKSKNNKNLFYFYPILDISNLVKLGEPS